MTTPDLNALAAEWRDARLLYPLYAALAREFVIELPAHPDLEAAVDAPLQESVEQARQWLLELDGRIQVHQLRQFLQTTTLGSDGGLRTLLTHYLHKAEHTDSDRDKIDFLLVQFFSHCAPSRLEDADVDLAYVSQMLEPVLGQVDLDVPEWLSPLDEVVQTANGCKNLNQLLTSRMLEKGRKLKTACGDKYYLPTALVAFTRFSFLMRRVFFRLMHQDLNAILDGLREPRKSRSGNPGLPACPVFCRRTHRASACSDLPVVESHVSRRIFLWTASVDAGGSSRRGGIRSRKNCKGSGCAETFPESQSPGCRGNSCVRCARI